MKVYKGKDQWKRKSKSDVKATTVDLCRADRDRMDKVRVMEEGSNGTTCEVRCIKWTGAFARVSSFSFPIPDLDVTHNRLMHDQDNNWFLSKIASERNRVRQAHSRSC